MGGESEAAWRAFLDDLVARKLATPDLLIIDGAPGLEAALSALWPDVPQQRCTGRLNIRVETGHKGSKKLGVQKGCRRRYPGAMQ